MARSPVRKKNPARKAPARPKRPGGRRLLSVPVGGGPAEPALLPGGAFRTDSWVNAATGLGGFTTDRAAASRYELEPIPSTRLIDALYTSDWLAARLVEKMPSIALVRGFGIEGADDPDEVLRAFEALNTTERYPEGAFQRAMFDGRAYGAAGLFLGYELGDPLSELDAEASGALAFLDVFRQDELKVLSRVKDPKRADFGMPELYEVIGTSGSGVMHPRRGQKFHASRLLRFTGKPLRTQNHELGAFPEIGVSVLAPVIRDISRYGMSWAAVSHLLQDASVGVMKLAGLVEGLADENDSVILDRLKTLQATKGITRMMFLDADAGEDYGRVAVSFADIPGVMAQIILSISGAADMPAKILFGTSPMGLNANSAGEADLTQFYNSVDEYRRRVIGPKLEAVLRAVTGNASLKIAWPSLWEPTENEKAQTRLTNANATRAYWDMGAVQATDIVKAAKEGNQQPETIGTPSDEREPDPEGEGPGAPPTAPQGGPGARLAAALASEGRRGDAEDEPEEDALKELERAKAVFEKRLRRYESELAGLSALQSAVDAAEAAVDAAEQLAAEAEEHAEGIEESISEIETHLEELRNPEPGDETDPEDTIEASERELAEAQAKLKEAQAKVKETNKAHRAAQRAYEKAERTLERKQPDESSVSDAASDYYLAAVEVGEEVAGKVEAEIDQHTERLTRSLSEERFQEEAEIEDTISRARLSGIERRISEGTASEYDKDEAEIIRKERAEHEQRMTEIGPRGGRYYTSVSGRRVYLKA